MSYFELLYFSLNPRKKLIKKSKSNDHLFPDIRTLSIPSKRERFYSSSDPQLENLTFEQKIQILLKIYKNQRRMSGCFEDEKSSLKREKLIEKCKQILKKLKLTGDQKESIFHRFCYLLGIITEKLLTTDHETSTEKKLNIIAIAIFLFSSKLEGVSTDKKFIINLVSNYMNESEENIYKILEKEIYEYGIKIFKILDEFCPQEINDNNLHQLSFFLWHLFILEFSINLDEDVIEEIQEAINYCNQIIEIKFSAVYNLYQIDKALISFYSSVKFILEKDKNCINNLKNFYSYLKKNLQITKMMEEDFKINCKDLIIKLMHRT